MQLKIRGELDNHLLKEKKLVISSQASKTDWIKGVHRFSSSIWSEFFENRQIFLAYKLEPNQIICLGKSNFFIWLLSFNFGLDLQVRPSIIMEKKLHCYGIQIHLKQSQAVDSCKTQNNEISKNNPKSPTRNPIKITRIS